MSRIKECTEELIKAISESEQYMHFSELREKVLQEPELRSQINDFRIKVFELQNSNEPLDIYEEQQKLYRELEEFRKNQLVNDYLAAELEICRVMQKITTSLTGAVDLDIHDFADRIGL